MFIAKHFYLFLLIFLSFAVLAPAAVFAQVIVDPNAPVPVPYNPQFDTCGLLGRIFGVCGPAGEVTATGLILGFIGIGLAIAGTLAVLFIIVGGIRYITAYGNEEQTEGAKKTLTNAIIGVVIVILAFVIVRVIVNALIFGGGGT